MNYSESSEFKKKKVNYSEKKIKIGSTCQYIKVLPKSVCTVPIDKITQ